jgi:hypothetical protein
LATFANSTYLSEDSNTILFFARGYSLPSRAVGRGYWITSRDIFRRLAPLKQKEANLLQYITVPQKHLKLKEKYKLN